VFHEDVAARGDRLPLGRCERIVLGARGFHLQAQANMRAERSAIFPRAVWERCRAKKGAKLIFAVHLRVSRLAAQFTWF
jgi:hypothetical protein